MAVREILKMGDPRLLRLAAPVTEFDTPDLLALVEDRLAAAAQSLELACALVRIRGPGAAVENRRSGDPRGRPAPRRRSKARGSR